MSSIIQLTHKSTTTIEEEFLAFSSFVFLDYTQNIKNVCSAIQEIKIDCTFPIAQQTLSFSLNYNQTGVRVDIPFILTLKWIAGKSQLEIKTEFILSSICGHHFSSFSTRTRQELMSSIVEMNKVFEHQNKMLRVRCHSQKGYIFQVNSVIIVIDSLSSIKKTKSKNIQLIMDQFVNIFKTINTCNFLIDPIEGSNYFKGQQSCFNRYYQKSTVADIHNLKTALRIKGYARQLALMNVKNNNISYQNLALVQKFKEDHITDQTIVESINITKQFKIQTLQMRKFRQNLLINQAATDDIVRCLYVEYTKYTTINCHRRSINSNNLLSVAELQKFRSQAYTDHLIFKKCFSRESTQKLLQKKKGKINKKQIISQQSHQRQFQFLLKLGSLKCPYIVKYFLNNEEAELPHNKRSILTKYEGTDLFTEIANKSASHRRVYLFDLYLKIFLQLANAVKFLRQNMYLHRDIKPTNAIIDEHYLLVKLIDFGSAAPIPIVKESEQIPVQKKQLATSVEFNLIYKEALKLTNGYLAYIMEEKQFNVHQNFDIYSIASTVKYLIQHSPYVNRYPKLQMIFNICMDPNPMRRFSPTELIQILVTMRIENDLFERNRVQQMMNMMKIKKCHQFVCIP